MSSRPYIVNQTANTQPTGQQLGDEWFDPVTNRLFKQVAQSGNVVATAEIITSQSGTANIAGNLTVGNVTGSGVIRNASVNVITDTTITPTSATTNQYNVLALASAATIATPSGVPIDGQRLVIRLEDNGVGRALTWTTTSGAYRAVGVILPTTTVATKVTYVGCIYNAQDIFWDVIAVSTQA
jgi:hypothetical protein